MLAWAFAAYGNIHEMKSKRFDRIEVQPLAMNRDKPVK